MVQLFFIISNILSCGRRVPRMTFLNSSSSYILLSARGCNMFRKECQNSSPLVLWKIFFMKASQWIMRAWYMCVVGWWKSTNRLALIINRFEMITLKIPWRNTTWSLMKIVEMNQGFRITLLMALLVSIQMKILQCIKSSSSTSFEPFPSKWIDYGTRHYIEEAPWKTWWNFTIGCKHDVDVLTSRLLPNS